MLRTGLLHVAAGQLATGDDRPGYVVDTLLRDVEWTHAAGFGNWSAAAVTDGDGRAGGLPSRGMALVPLDQDPALEYVMNTAPSVDARVGSFDGETHVPGWNSDSWAGVQVEAIVAADLERTGGRRWCSGRAGTIRPGQR